MMKRSPKSTEIYNGEEFGKLRASQLKSRAKRSL